MSSRHRRPRPRALRWIAVAAALCVAAAAGAWSLPQLRAEQGALPSACAPAPSESAAASPSPSPSTQTPCGRTAAATPAVKVTDVDLGVRVTGYARERDTDPLPMALAAAPDGGSWLAWLGTDGKVYLGRLDCDDKLTGAPTAFEGVDLQDVHADSTGGVILLTRKGNCGGGRLCGGTSSPCFTSRTPIRDRRERP